MVVLRYWEDRSVAETARQLGMSEARSAPRASRAMVKLRETLAPSKGAVDMSTYESETVRPHGWHRDTASLALSRQRSAM